MADRKTWLDGVLKRKSFNESPLQVVAVEETSSVVGKGENYLSKIERVKATVLLGSGKTKQISLIVKNQHETEQMKKLSLELGVFFREISMYRDILPKMEDLLDEINDSEGILWGECYDYRLYDRIVFEDLGAIGYKMADRKKQLGLESALLVVKGLAKFHALSKILLSRGDVPMDIFGKHIWGRNPEMTIKMTTENAGRLLNAMRKWGDEWQDATDRFEKALPNLGRQFVEALDTKPDDFAVLCHGDCWTNNMLFKGDLENPTSVKLVDMQTVAVTNQAFDFHLFVGSSVRPDVSEIHYDELLKQYHTAFVSYMTALNFKGTLPSLEETKEFFDKNCILMLGWVIVLGVLVTNDTSDHPDLEENIKQEIEANEKGEDAPERFDQFQKLNESTINMYKSCVRKCIDCGII